MKIKGIIKRYMSIGILNSIALMAAVQSANQACIWLLHQPEFPDEANVLKKH
jgi:hypothetical protein